MLKQAIIVTLALLIVASAVVAPKTTVDDILQNLTYNAPEGVAIFKNMAKTADVIVENYRPGVKHRLGIDRHESYAFARDFVGTVAGAGTGGITGEGIGSAGASTGGTEATRAVLVALPHDAPAVVITQHMPPGFTTSFAARLNGLCLITVQEAVNGARVLPGHAYIAPGGKQFWVEKSGASVAGKHHESSPHRI